MRSPSPPMKETCLQVTRRLSKLLGSQDDSDQTGTQPTNELVKTLYQHTALGGGLTPGSPKQPKRFSWMYTMIPQSVWLFFTRKLIIVITEFCYKWDTCYCRKFFVKTIHNTYLDILHKLVKFSPGYQLNFIGISLTHVFIY